MTLSKRDTGLFVILILVTASVWLASPVTAQEGIDTSNLDISEVTAPSEVELGESVEITSNAAIPNLPADWSAQLEFVAYADNSQIGTQNIHLEDGDNVDVSVDYSFQQAGSKELYFEVTGELTRKGTVTEQSATVDRTTPSVVTNVIDTTPAESEETQEDDGSVIDRVEGTTDNLGTDISVEGAVFAAPEPVQSQVDELRENIPASTDRVSHAFVLATSDGLHLVLTNEEPKEGYASIQGGALNSADISLTQGGESDLELKPIRATEVEYQDPSKASVEEVYQNTDDYRRDYVKFTANHRSLALDDEQSDYKTTTGILVDDPLRSEDLFGNVGERSSTMLNEVDGGSAGSVLGDRSRPHVVTTAYGTETDYWENTAVTMTGIVASPQSPAGKFIRSQQQYGTLLSDSGTPILYVIDKQYDVEDVSISEVSENPAAYEGDTVRFESNLYMNTISSKRVIESTGTKLPPVDTVLHGGVAWDQLPETREDLIGVMAASSITQNQLTRDRTGSYRVTGEVISTDKIEGDLPQAYVLIAYDLEKTGSIDTASVGNFGTQQSTAISGLLERQANPDLDAATASGTGTTTQSTSSDGERGNTDSSESNTDQDTESDRPIEIKKVISEIITRITRLFS